MEARYAEVARKIVGDISSGRIAVGSQLPSEVELAGQYEVSRATIRSALTVVENLGLISRRRRAGTRVESAQPTTNYAGSVMTVSDLVQYAAETERHVRTISEVVCDDALAHRLGCRPGQRWLKVQMLRTEPGPKGRAICWTDVYLEPSIGQAIRRKVRQAHGLICDMIEEQCGRFIVEVRQAIRAVLMPDDKARELAVAPQSAALEICRHYFDQTGDVLQITLSVHPGDRFEYGFALRRDGAAKAE